MASLAMSARVRGRFLLHGFHGAEFHALFVRGNLVTLSHIKVVACHQVRPFHTENPATAKMFLTLGGRRCWRPYSLASVQLRVPHWHSNMRTVFPVLESIILRTIIG
jgi:hypothetical protein